MAVRDAHMAKPSDLPSTFPPAALMVVPRGSGKPLSGVLVARDSGYLVVEVSFHGAPVAGLEVQFFLATHDGERGGAIGKTVSTDQDGIARATRVVPSGLYVCAIENQDDLVVTTVAELGDAYPVVLPVGRSYADMHDGLEFEGPDGAHSNGEGDKDGDNGTEDNDEPTDGGEVP